MDSITVNNLSKAYKQYPRRWPVAAMAISLILGTAWLPLNYYRPATFRSHAGKVADELHCPENLIVFIG